jgi:hypothetical protein
LPSSFSGSSPERRGPGAITARPAIRAAAPALILACALIAPARAAADDWFLVPAVGVTFGSDTNLVDLDDAARRTKLVLGGGVLWLDEGWFGVDGEVTYISGLFERAGSSENPRLVTSSAVTTAMGSVVVALPLRISRNSLRPYFIGGFGLMHASIDDVLNVLPVEANLLGMKFGGGAIGFVSDTVGVRWDLSYLRSLKGQGDDTGVSFGSRSLSFWRASMGIVLRF